MRRALTLVPILCALASAAGAHDAPIPPSDCVFESITVDVAAADGDRPRSGAIEKPLGLRRFRIFAAQRITFTDANSSTITSLAPGGRPFVVARPPGQRTQSALGGVGVAKTWTELSCDQ